MSIGSNTWGPYAWHLLHSFSIGNNEEIEEEDIHSYYIFYTSFQYILPCPLCAEHYKNIIEIELPLYEEYICRDYLKKWVYQLHNIVNDTLNKNIKVYSYKKCIEENKIIRPKDIHFLINKIYLNFYYENMSIHKFENIFTFFKLFCKLYPHTEVRNNIKELNIMDDLETIISPRQFQNWLKNKYKLLDFIRL